MFSVKWSKMDGNFKKRKEKKNVAGKELKVYFKNKN